MKARRLLAPLPLGLVVAAAATGFDQLGKWWILAVVMDPPRVIPLAPFFNVVLVMNRGASFGLFGDAPRWVPWMLSGFAVLISVALVIWMRRAETRLLAAALGFVVGGALGNVIDRVRYGAVVDFLDLYAGDLHWPAFNLADVAITTGVVLLLLDSLKSTPKRR